MTDTEQLVDVAVEEVDMVRTELITALTLLRHNDDGLTDEQKLAKLDDIIDKAVDKIEDNVIGVLSRI
jgi:hypothetical protein